MYIPILTELIQSLFTEPEYWDYLQECKLKQEIEELVSQEENPNFLLDIPSSD